MAQAKTFIVTGGNVGLGFQCASYLSADPDNLVILACRDVGKAELSAQKLRAAGGKIVVLRLDLSEQASVRAFVKDFRERAFPPLAGLVCNAGVQNIAAPTRTAEGFETTFAVNHLAHYLLARLLLPDLCPAARIVFVSSGTHDPKEKTGLPEPRYVDAESVAHDFEPGAEAGRRRYTTSKLCNIFCAREFAKRLDATADSRLRSIRVNAFDPGLMPGTGLARTYPAPIRFVWNYILPVATLFRRNVHRTSTSGRRLARLASDGDATGKYFSDGRETRSSELSFDAAKAGDLWNASADMTQLPRELQAA